MNTLRFDELKEANLARVGEFKNRLGRIAHAKSDGSDWTLAEWTNAMAGEAGEACNYSKKIRRGDYDDDLSVGIDLLLKEIADVVIYADLVASQTGRSLSHAIIQKFNEKSDEVGSKVKLSATPYLPPARLSSESHEVLLSEPAPGSLLCFWDGSGFRKLLEDGTPADPKQWRSYVRIHGNTVVCRDAKELPRCFMIVQDPATVVAVSQADGDAPLYHGEGEDAGLDRTTFHIQPNAAPRHVVAFEDNIPKIVRE